MRNLTYNDENYKNCKILSRKITINYFIQKYSKKKFIIILSEIGIKIKISYLLNET